MTTPARRSAPFQRFQRFCEWNALKAASIKGRYAISQRERHVTSDVDVDTELRDSIFDKSLLTPFAGLRDKDLVILHRTYHSRRFCSPYWISWATVITPHFSIRGVERYFIYFEIRKYHNLRMYKFLLPWEIQFSHQNSASFLNDESKGNLSFY